MPVHRNNDGKKPAVIASGCFARTAYSLYNLTQNTGNLFQVSHIGRLSQYKSYYRSKVVRNELFMIYFYFIDSPLRVWYDAQTLSILCYIEGYINCMDAYSEFVDCISSRFLLCVLVRVSNKVMNRFFFIDSGKALSYVGAKPLDFQ